MLFIVLLISEPFFEPHILLLFIRKYKSNVTKSITYLLLSYNYQTYIVRFTTKPPG